MIDIMLPWKQFSLVSSHISDSLQAGKLPQVHAPISLLHVGAHGLLLHDSLALHLHRPSSMSHISFSIEHWISWQRSKIYRLAISFFTKGASKLFGKSYFELSYKCSFAQDSPSWVHSFTANKIYPFFTRLWLTIIWVHSCTCI